MTNRNDRIRDAASKMKETVSSKLRRLWWGFLLRGIVAVALAVCALFWPQQTIEVLTKLLGVYFLVDGVLSLFSAWRNGDYGAALLPAVVSLAAGLVLIFWTDASTKIFLLIVGLWAASQAIGLLTTAWQMDRADENRSLVAVAGLVVLVVGIVFVIWPETGVVSVSWLIGITALVIGGVFVFLATRLKRGTRKLSHLGQQPVDQ